MWTPSIREIQAVNCLGGGRRYSYFIKKAADTEVVWTIRDPTGWALLADASGQLSMPVWPHRAYVEAAQAASPSEYPASLPLELFLEKWIPGLRSDGYKMAVMPTPDGKGVVVDPDRFLADLEDEL